MSNFKTFFNQCIFALSLAGAAAGALAGPTNFSVVVDTRALTGSGLLTFAFGQTGNAGPVVATVSGLTGNFSGVTPTGDVNLLADGFTIDNLVVPDGSFADVNATFGDYFRFNLAFTSDFMNEIGTDSSTLALFLTNADYTSAVTGSALGLIGQFDIPQGGNIAVVPVDRRFVSVNAVPEPSELLLMLAGLSVMGLVVRRRPQR